MSSRARHPIVACCLILVSTMNSQGAEWVVTDRSEWEALVGGVYTLENFSDASLATGLSVISDFGSISSGRWNDNIRVTDSDTRESRFFFDQPTNAFGANFDMGLGGSGIHMLLDDTEIVVPRVADSFNGEFFGFVSDTSFTSVTFLSRLPGQGNYLETYTMDNLVYSSNFGGTIVQPDPIPMQTASHPVATTLQIDLYLGDPDAGGQLLKSTGPNSLDGSIELIIDLDASGTGYVQFQTADMNLQDFGPSLIDVGALGTIEASLSGIHLMLESVRLEVVDYEFAAAPTMPITMDINAGTAALSNPTGILASLIPGGYVIDFGTDPLVVSANGIFGVVEGSVDLGPDLFVNGPELNAEVLPFSYLLDSLNGVGLYARFSASIHVATVPEASSLLLCGSVLGCTLVSYRRRRDRS